MHTSFVQTLQAASCIVDQPAGSVQHKHSDRNPPLWFVRVMYGHGTVLSSYTPSTKQGPLELGDGSKSQLPGHCWQLTIIHRSYHRDQRPEIRDQRPETRGPLCSCGGSCGCGRYAVTASACIRSASRSSVSSSPTDMRSRSGGVGCKS